MDYFVKSDSVGTISLFKRRKPVKLTHSGVLTDYQYYETFDYEPAMLNNFDDIRFVTQSGEHVPYWIETKTDGVSAKVWFMNDYVDGDTYIWMYYGSEGLSSGSSGIDTFIQWHGTASAEFHDSNIITPPVIYEGKVRQTTDSETVLWGIGEVVNLYTTAGTDDKISIMSYGAGNVVYLNTFNDGGHTSPSEAPNLVQNQWHNIQIDIVGASEAHGYVDGNEIATGATTNIPNEAMGLAFYEQAGSGEQEWSFARKYTAVEPTVTVGAEQHPKKGDIMIL